MTDQPENLIIEILRKIQTDIGELKEQQRTTNLRLSAIEHHMAGFHTSATSSHDEIDELRRRVEQLERRLELRD